MDCPPKQGTGRFNMTLADGFWLVLSEQDAPEAIWGRLFITLISVPKRASWQRNRF